jgi:predicted metal-dependent hydrolase
MIKQNFQYGTTKIEYDLEYSKRKTLGIKVHPDKSVQVLAPLESCPSKVKEKVYKKASWILKQQDFFLSFHPLTPVRKYVSGETHLYLGKQYRLKVIESKLDEVKMGGGYIKVNTADTNDYVKIKSLLDNWYKEKAIIHFNQLFTESVPLTEAFYNGTPDLKFRWMSKRWGTCDKKGTIHLNLELIKAPKSCIKYVIIHEMCHLLHLNHSKAFYDLLKKLYPEWQLTKNKLEKLMV